QIAGYTTGFRPNAGTGPDTQRLFDNYLHRLVGPTGSVENFISSMEDRFRDAAISDLNRTQSNKIRNAAVKDPVIGSYLHLGKVDGRQNADSEQRMVQMFEAQNEQEAEYFYNAHKLKRLEVKK